MWSISCRACRRCRSRPMSPRFKSVAAKKRTRSCGWRCARTTMPTRRVASSKSPCARVSSASTACQACSWSAVPSARSKCASTPNASWRTAFRCSRCSMRCVAATRTVVPATSSRAASRSRYAPRRARTMPRSLARLSCNARQAASCACAMWPSVSMRTARLTASSTSTVNLALRWACSARQAPMSST